MPEKEEKVEITEPEPTEIVKPEEPEVKQEAKSPEDVLAELDETRKALSKANREAAQRRKQLEAYENEEKKRKDAELSEVERLQKQLTESQTELERLNYQKLQRSIADEVGLPAVFASRIQGDTEEAMTEDAKQLLEAMPKQQKTVINPTNPGHATQGMTDDQRRARLYRGDITDPFDPASAREKGGGVHFITPE